MGDLLHPNSCECAFCCLDLFAVPPTQSSVENGFWVEHHPISTLTDTGPVEFVVNGSGEEYTDLPETFLHVRVKVTKPDRGALTDTDIVAPTNLYAEALFSQVDVSLNGNLTTPSQNTYPWRCFLESLLSYGPDALGSQLALSGSSRDTAGELDNMDGEKNEGFAERAKWIKGSKECDMLCRVHADIFHQEKFLINGVCMKLHFVRSKNSFVLLTSDDQAGYKVKLTQASLYVRRCKINPATVLAHEKAYRVEQPSIL
ncbi:hypothetical protein PoB_002208700 [Plakobranchus ocellatus]|uniref:TIP41-like protein n=1 Tax=Plakobranchus ocellatus TaxID=259542 RepID=A0AAV3ZJV9_9GAST|nr:hypothetical protein PoB_002208700 [Plakobranchus ocellatus]